LKNPSRKFVIAATFVFATTLAISGQVHATPQAPTEGITPFYVWQEDIPEVMGTLLRQEPLEKKLVLDSASAGVRVLYASKGWNNQPVVVSGDILIPEGRPPEGGWPVLAWSHGTVGVADACAPSHNGRAPRDIAYLNKWLTEGYAIVSTDYEGLGTSGGHTYLHCKSEANGNIDAVLAAQQAGLNLSKSWLVIGQSQGGQGALCTGAYVADRSGELDFRGTLATAPAVNWKDRFFSGGAEDPNPFIGMSLYLARGFEVYEPHFNTGETFTDAAMALMPYTETLCVSELIGVGMKANLSQGQSLKIVPIGKAPGVLSATQKMDVPTSGWSAPVYIAQGTADTLVRFEDARKFALALCDENIQVFFDAYEGAEHSGPLNQGFDAFSQWVANRFAGKPGSSNCQLIKDSLNKSSAL
jgi:acetyl esterase/lipase